MRGKLTLSDAIAIRVRARRGERQVDLAREYGVRESTISMICTGKTHQHHLAKQFRRPPQAKERER